MSGFGAGKSESKRVVFFTGCRSEWGLLKPLVAKFPEAKLLVSGSHFCADFSADGDCFCFPDVEKVEMLLDSDSPSGMVKSMAVGLIGYADALVRLAPEVLVILGDRFEAVAAALAAYTLFIPICHIEGSDVTKGSLDDGYRRCIDQLASLKLPVERFGSLGCVFDCIEEPPFEVSAVVVYHPCRGNWQQEFSAILEVMQNWPDAVFIKPCPDAGSRWINQMLEEAGVRAVNLTRPLYLGCLRKADFIIGNSSSGIIEAPSLGTATINIGCRQAGRKKAASVIDCPGDYQAIMTAIRKTELIDWPVENPYYKPKTLMTMARAIRKFVLSLS